jgi:hypothetical protein
MVAPVGAGTGPSAETAAVTAKRVKRIATRVFNKNAPKLRDKCPSGTTRFAGACFETTSRAAASFKAASTTCGNLGRRLPTGSELFGLRLVPGITLAGSTTDAEMTSNLFRDGTFGFMVMEDDGDLYGHQGIFTDLQNPFRCVAPLTNG